jgi:hypothetical protein
MVCNGEDAELIAYHGADDPVGKTPYNEATLAVAPNGAEARIRK